MEEKLKQIINHYEVMPQLKYIHSEYFELDEAIMNYEWAESEYGRCNNSNIAGEIADILVMLKQFQYYYGISDKQIEDIMSYKIDRQLERIKNGKDK